MYRYQWTLEIQYGRKREFLEIVDHIKRLEESRGWVVASLDCVLRTSAFRRPRSSLPGPGCARK
jgi:hypothetical protein